MARQPLPAAQVVVAGVWTLEEGAGATLAHVELDRLMTAKGGAVPRA